jgi:hypothetical protein
MVFTSGEQGCFNIRIAININEHINRSEENATQWWKC